MNENKRVYLINDADIEKLISAVNEIPDEDSRKRVAEAIIAAFNNSQQEAVNFLEKLAEESVRTILERKEKCQS